MNTYTLNNTSLPSQDRNYERHEIVRNTFLVQEFSSGQKLSKNIRDSKCNYE